MFGKFVRYFCRWEDLLKGLSQKSFIIAKRSGLHSGRL